MDFKKWLMVFSLSGVMVFFLLLLGQSFYPVPKNHLNSEAWALCESDCRQYYDDCAIGKDEQLPKTACYSGEDRKQRLLYCDDKKQECVEKAKNNSPLIVWQRNAAIICLFAGLFILLGAYFCREWEILKYSFLISSGMMAFSSAMIGEKFWFDDYLTIGNIIVGAIMCGLIYFAYKMSKKK